MRNYQIVDHTADVQIQVTGDSLTEVFRAGMEGMSEIIYPGFCQQSDQLTEETSVKIQAPDRTALLIDFLSEVLYYTQTNHVLYCTAQFDRLEPTECAAILKGCSTNHFEEDIKAVTYHDAEIQTNNKGQLTTPVIFDI